MERDVDDVEDDVNDTGAGDQDVNENVDGHVDVEHAVADDVGVDNDVNVERAVHVVDDVDVEHDVDDVGVKRSHVGSKILEKVASYRLCGKVAVA